MWLVARESRLRCARGRMVAEAYERGLNQRLNQADRLRDIKMKLQGGEDLTPDELSDRVIERRGRHPRAAAAVGRGGGVFCLSVTVLAGVRGTG